MDDAEKEAAKQAMQVERAESNASTAGISGDKSKVKGTLQNAAGAVKIQSTTIKGYADDAIKKGHGIL